MFFGFGLPIFQEPEPNQQQNQGGGFLDFIANFMNPRAQQQQPQQQPPQARPTYKRSSGTDKDIKKQSQQKQKVAYDSSSGMYWKQKGNQCFIKKDYKTAIEHYSKAISISEDTIFYTNRARSYKMIKQYENAVKDCQNAIQLDQKNIKANLIAGQCLSELGKNQQKNDKIETAITRLKKALVLSSSQKNSSYVRDINIYIYRAKKLFWYKKFNQHRDKKIKTMTQYKNYVQKDESLTAEQAQQKIRQFMACNNQTVKFVIPDYFICQITYDIMQDPVTTDSGQTYERSAIEQSIQRNGKTDPFTRSPISGNLYTNFALKKAIQDFIDNNPWAYEFNEGEDYTKIQF